MSLEAAHVEFAPLPANTDIRLPQVSIEEKDSQTFSYYCMFGVGLFLCFTSIFSVFSTQQFSAYQWAMGIVFVAMSIRYGRIQYAGTLTIDFNSETVTFKQNVNLIRRITTKNTSHNNRSIMLRDVVSIEAYKIVRPPQEEALIQTKVILSSEKDTPGEKDYINVSGGGFCPQSSFVFLKTHWLKWKKNTEVGREQVGKCKEDEEILLLNAGIISSDTDKYISRRVLYQERGSSLFEQGSSALLAVDDTH